MELEDILSQLQDIENELAKAQQKENSNKMNNCLSSVQSYVSEAICEIEQFNEEEE